MQKAGNLYQSIEGLVQVFCIPKYISEVAGGKFVVSPCIHKKLPELYLN